MLATKMDSTGESKNHILWKFSWLGKFYINKFVIKYSNFCEFFSLNGKPKQVKGHLLVECCVELPEVFKDEMFHFVCVLISLYELCLFKDEIFQSIYNSFFFFSVFLLSMLY